MKIVLTSGVEVKGDYDPEELYIVYKLSVTQKITAYIHVVIGGKSRQLDPALMCPRRTFGDLIQEWYADTLVPPREVGDEYDSVLP